VAAFTFFGGNLVGMLSEILWRSLPAGRVTEGLRTLQGLGLAQRWDANGLQWTHTTSIWIAQARHLIVPSMF